MSLKFSAIFAVIIIAFVIHCGDSFEEKHDRAVLEALREDILDMIGEPLCGGDGECRYIAFGSKPCGGPWEYLIYSVDVTDSVLLTQRVETYNEYEDMMNRKYGYVSDCSVPEPPILGCVEGVCVDTRVHLDP
jgi:hypothetical protein